MARFNDLYTEESESNCSFLDANIYQATKESSSIYQVKNFISVSFFEQRAIHVICGSRNKEIVFKLNKLDSNPRKLFFLKEQKFLVSGYVVNVELPLLISIDKLLIRTQIILMISSIKITSTIIYDLLIDPLKNGSVSTNCVLSTTGSRAHLVHR